MSIVLETVIPHIKAYNPQFQWQENKFVVHDAKWIDLSKHPSLQPYFYNKCLHASNRKGSKAPVFKSKQFGLFIIVPEHQWEEFEMFRDKLKASPPPPPPTRTQRISQPVYTASHQSVMVSTPVVPSLTLTSEPSTPLFLSKGQTTTTTSSSVFDRPISQDIQCLRDSYVGVFTV